MILTSGEVVRVQAYDKDIGQNAQLTYSLVGVDDLKHFEMVTDKNQGVVKIFKVSNKTGVGGADIEYK